MSVEQLGPTPTPTTTSAGDPGDRRTARGTGARAVRPARGRGRPLPRDVRVLLGLYALVCLALLAGAWRSRFNLSNIDGISYMSIAQQYADGSWDTAVNAFWSPLVSWLMVPPLVVGLSGPLAFTLVNAAAGAVGVAVGTALVWRHTGGHAWASGLFLGCSSVFFGASLYLLTPDLLVATWAIVFVGALSYVAEGLLGGSRWAPWSRGAVLGVVCAVGYLTKLYLVPVVLVSVPLWCGLVLWWHRNAGRPLRGPRGAVLRLVTALAAALVGFAAVAAPWVAALSDKYDGFTLGSSFTVNIEAKFDPTAAEIREQPLRMWEPPNDRAVSFGEDRTFDTDGPAFDSPVPLAERAEYYVTQRLAAFPHYVNRVNTVAPFATTTTAVFLVAVLFGRFRAPQYRLAKTAAVVWVVYFAGYAAITTAANAGGSPRYYWPLLPVWLLLACSLVPALWRLVDARGSRWRQVLATVLVALVPLSVVWTFGLGRSQPFSTAEGPRGVASLLATPAQRGALQVLAEDALSSAVRPGDSVLGSNFRATVQMAYYLGAQVYGRAAQPYDPDDPAFRELLREHDIDWYLYFAPVGAAEPVPAGLAEIGPTVGSWTATVSCADVAAAPPQPCTLTLVEVADR